MMRRMWKKLFSIKNSLDCTTYKFFGLRFKIKRNGGHAGKLLRDCAFSMPYYRDYMLLLDSIYRFKGKKVIEIGADYTLECASAAVKLGAEAVYAINPQILVDSSPHPSVHMIKQLGEETDLESAAFDLVYGFALLEHVVNPRKMASEVARLLKKGGHAFLSGTPLWLSPYGHHVYITINGRDYRFTDKNLFAGWEHLAYDSYNEFYGAVHDRIPDEAIQAVYHQMYKDRHISRLTADEIIAAFEAERGLKVEAQRYTTSTKPNEHYKKALSRHTKADLTTEALDLRCTRI